MIGAATERDTTGRDDGMQQERTRLAWRRTGLTLAAAAVFVGRSAPTAPVAVVLVCGGALLIALWAVGETLRGRRMSARSTVDAAFDDVLYDGRLPCALATVVVLLCLVELMLVIV